MTLPQKDFDPTPQNGLAHVIGDTGQAIWHRTIPNVFEETVERYLRWVRPMHEAYVWPSMRKADLIVRNYRDPSAAIRLLIKALGG